MAEARRGETLPWKEGQVGPGMSLRVGVEQMVGAWIVLVDALLDQPHAEHAGIEVQVFLCRAGNGGDVVKAVDALHPAIMTRGRAAPNRRNAAATVRCGLCEFCSSIASQATWACEPPDCTYASSPCMQTSRPTASSDAVARSGNTSPTSFSRMKVPTAL